MFLVYSVYSRRGLNDEKHLALADVRGQALEVVILELHYI